MRNKLIKMSTILFFLIAVTSIVAVIDAMSQTAKPIIIGAPVPRASAYGQNGERGMILAAEEINSAGGVKVGDVKRPFKLEIVDTRDEEPGVPTVEVLLAIEKLILQKNADVIAGGPVMSECGLAAMDLYAKHKIVDIVSIGCLTPAWDKKVAENREKYKYSFRISGSVGGKTGHIADAISLLHQIKEQQGFNKMFIAIEDSAMCRAAAEIVSNLASKDGWQIVGFVKHPIAATDFSVMLSECKKSGAQVLFLWTYSPETSILLRQWADMKVPALPFGLLGAAEDPGFWKATNGKVAYTVVSLGETGDVPGNTTPWTQKFYSAFEKRWGVPPRSYGCVMAYEALWVLKDAIERAGKIDRKEPDSLIAALEKTKYPGVRGTIMFDENHHIIQSTDPAKGALGCWAQWQDGQRVCVFPEASATGKIKIPPWLK